MKKFVIGVCLLVCAVALFGCAPNIADEQQDIFKLGFLPTESASELTPKAEALANFLESELNMPVEIFIPTGYESLIEALRFNQVDAAFMDSSPAWLASQKAGAEVVLAETKDGESYYFAELFVRADSDIKSLEDVIGKKIAFTSMTGSSGFIFPIGEMISKGLIKPADSDFASLEKALQESFESYTVSGGYTQSLRLLLDGKVDVVGGADYAPAEFLTPEELAKIKTLVRIGKSPSHPVVVRAELSEALRQKFVAAMLKLNEPANVGLLTDIYGVNGLIETSTQEHLGDLGGRFSLVTGIQEKVLEKKD